MSSLWEWGPETADYPIHDKDVPKELRTVLHCQRSPAFPFRRKQGHEFRVNCRQNAGNGGLDLDVFEEVVPFLFGGVTVGLDEV